MAYIVTTSRKLIKVTPEQGNRIWRLLKGELEPKDQVESDKLDKIDRVILNSKNPSTPASYLVAHQFVYVPDSFASTMGVRNV